MKITRIGLNRNEIALRESLFHIANGYLGVRACFEEGTPADVRSIRGAYLNAFYDLTPIVYAEKMHGFPEAAQTIVNIVDQQGITLWLHGEPFSPFTGTLLLFEQTLDMALGQYIRHVVWRSPAGLETELRFCRMASFYAKELMTIDVAVTPRNWSGTFQAVSTQISDVYNDGDPNDPRKASERKRRLQTQDSGHHNGCMYMRCQAIGSGEVMACAALHTSDSGLQGVCSTSPASNSETISGKAEQGKTISFVKWCVYTDSRRHHDPMGDAQDMVRDFASLPIDTWYARQRTLLNDLWDASRIIIEGSPSLQTGVDFAIYSLFQSAGRDGISSIASKGLSGEGYEGHFFWDTEIYMFPFFLLTHPQIARALLDFRYATLDGAREQARLLGHKNCALYPWRTITGSECSAYFPSGSAQYHINSDIAHAVITYYDMTGDLDYMMEKGAELLVETARLWLDTGHWKDGQFRIDGVTGPDEYTCLVNNNYYTNLSMQYHLRSTLRICADLERAYPSFSARESFGLTESEKQAFQEASDKVLLPYDETLGIFAQDDSFLQKQKLALSSLPKEAFPLLLSFHPLAFNRRQVCKQADAVLAHFLYEDGIPEDVMRRTYLYYEEITTHDSSLSQCVFSMMAARIGETEKAYTYFMNTAHMDTENKQGNTDDGIHAANMGGTYMGIVFGFAGLRIHANGLSLHPCIPKALERYAFPICYQGKRIHLQVDHETITLQGDSTEPISITVYGLHYAIDTQPLSIPLKRISNS